MREVAEQSASCPYCGEPIELFIDLSAGSADYIEDCQVCCRPMQIRFEIDGEDIINLIVDSDG
ncbi:MAG: CPXCG motif-containing cysteine-rich protein [Woeseiaceae bacterium]